MREKLIQLLAAVHPVSQEACVQLHDYIQSVRCENCRHWVKYDNPKRRDYQGLCDRTPYGGDVGGCNADFFCACFEVRS